MAANLKKTTGNPPRKAVMLGGILGQLSVGKVFELAKTYHTERRRQAERSMTPIENEKLTGLFYYVIHGNWSDPKNAHFRRQFANTSVGREWEFLNNADRNQAMAAYIIMVDQVHKGFEAYAALRVKRIRQKEAKRGARQLPHPVVEVRPPTSTRSSSRKSQDATRPGIPSPMVQKNENHDKDSNEKHLHSSDYSNGQESDGYESKDFDYTVPSGSCANSERGDESNDDSDSESSSIAAVPETRSRGTITCERCLRISGKKMVRHKLREAEKNKPMPVMVDASTQTVLPPKWFFELRRHFTYNDGVDIRYLLDTILGQDIDNKFRSARSSFSDHLNVEKEKLPYNFTVSMVAMIGVIEGKSSKQMSEEFDILRLHLEDYDMYATQFEDEEIFIIKCEFVVNVYQACPQFKSHLSSPLAKVLEDYIRLRNCGADEEDINILTIDNNPTDFEKVVKYYQVARRKTIIRPKKVIKRNTDAENCLKFISEDIKILRELHATEIAAMRAAGKPIPDEEIEDAIKNHHCKHTPEDCDDTIEYFSNRVWKLYKKITPDVWTTEDILSWCDEKIAKKGRLNFAHLS